MMEIYNQSFVIYFLLILFALAIGSLLNVIIYRIPFMMDSTIITKKIYHSQDLQFAQQHLNELNLFFPRSFCPICKNKIAILHNIPLLSYILLLGRCAKCDHLISPRYPLVEFLCATCTVFFTWWCGLSLLLCFVLLFHYFLIVLFFIDLEKGILPDNLTLSLLWLGLLINTQAVFTDLSNAVISSVIAYLILWLFVKIYYLFSGKIGMGNGDFKLFAAFAAWFGWEKLPFILLFASFLGTICGVVYLAIKQETKDTPIPFGPFLCFAAAISMIRSLS